MLAAECVWRILRVDHARMRELLDGVGAVLRDGGWRGPGEGLTSLRRFIDSLRAFDLVSHRPKGVALLGALRGRSPDADALLVALEQESDEADAMLVQALRMLDAIEGGDPEQAPSCAALLEQHQSLLRRHLDEEDTVLFAKTAQLLSPQDWSRVASAMSSLLYR